MVRSKIFNFHHIKLIVIAMLKTGSSQVTTICEYKIDTGSGIA